MVTVTNFLSHLDCGNADVTNTSCHEGHISSGSSQSGVERDWLYHPTEKVSGGQKGNFERSGDYFILGSGIGEALV